MGVYLPTAALPGLKRYKYAAEDHSLISKYILKPFYTSLIELFPKWLAPNLITLLGLIFSAVGFATAVYLNPTFDPSIRLPRWAYFSFAVELFVYQTLDALDGQQARRTGSSSPLGELFDHCVDAINTTLGVIIFCISMNFSPAVAFGAEVACTLNFYLSTWEEYHTGKLYLSGFSGPVEGVLMCCLFEVINGIVGPGVWDTELLWGVTIKTALEGGMAFGLIGNTAEAIKHVAQVSVGDLPKRLMGLVPFVGLWTGFSLWAFVAPVVVSGLNLVVYISTVGLVFALLVGQIITAHVTKQAFPMWTTLLLVPAGGAIVQLVAPSNQLAYLWFALGTCFATYGGFVSEVITEITTFLDIGCFYLKRKPE